MLARLSPCAVYTAVTTLSVFFGIVLSSVSKDALDGRSLNRLLFNGRPPSLLAAEVPGALVKGDCNLDRSMNLADAIVSLWYQFKSPDLTICMSLCDTNSDGLLHISDAILLLNHLFLAGPAPEDPLLTSEELCDGLDNNCDRQVDEGCPASGGDELTLAWDPVRFDTQGNARNVAGYLVYFGSGSRSYIWVENAGLNLQHTVTGLVPGVTYYFAVTSYDGEGNESDFSLEVSGQGR